MEGDLQTIFKPHGDIVRIFLAKDKNTGVSKGFAFINYRVRWIPLLPSITFKVIKINCDFRKLHDYYYPKFLRSQLSTKIKI